VTAWTTAAVILERSGASSSPSPDDLAFAEECAAAVNEGIDQVLEDRLADGSVTGTEAELVRLASMAGIEAYKQREAVFGVTGYVDLQGAAIRIARDYLDAQRPILNRYASPGLA
jgi:hypothetical protein